MCSNVRTESDVLFHYISYDLVIRVLKDHARIFADIPQMRLVPRIHLRYKKRTVGQADILWRKNT